MHVDETNPAHNTYDLIVGRDLLHELGFKLDFHEGKMEWDNAWINMQDPTFFIEERVAEFEEELFLMYGPETTESDRIQEIMDVKYAPANLEKEVNKLKELNIEQKSKVLKLLQKYEHLFDGDPFKWKGGP